MPAALTNAIQMILQISFRKKNSSSSDSDRLNLDLWISTLLLLLTYLGRGYGGGPKMESWVTPCPTGAEWSLAGCRWASVRVSSTWAIDQCSLRSSVLSSVIHLYSQSVIINSECSSPIVSSIFSSEYFPSILRIYLAVATARSTTSISSFRVFFRISFDISDWIFIFWFFFFWSWFGVWWQNE